MDAVAIPCALQQWLWRRRALAEWAGAPVALAGILQRGFQQDCRSPWIWVFWFTVTVLASLTAAFVLGFLVGRASVPRAAPVCVATSGGSAVLVSGSSQTEPARLAPSIAGQASTSGAEGLSSHPQLLDLIKETSPIHVDLAQLDDGEAGRRALRLSRLRRGGGALA